MSNSDLVRRAREMGGFSPEAELCSLMADEIERLRASLRAIRDYEGHNPVIYDADDAIAMKEIARAALGEKE